MTAKEQERLARMEQRQDDMAEDIKEIKLLLQSQNKTFLTRVEAKAYGAAITFIFAVVTIYFQIKDHLK